MNTAISNQSEFPHDKMERYNPASKKKYTHDELMKLPIEDFKKPYTYQKATAPANHISYWTGKKVSSR